MTSSEQTVLDAIIPRLRDEGYEVFVKPSLHMLPPFMQNHLPDAIAMRPDKRLAIEVVRDDASSQAKLKRFRDALEQHKDWELRVYWINAFAPEPQIETSDLQSIGTSVRQVKTLLDQGYALAALLQAWANFEAAARALAPTQLSRPQTPARLIEALAFDGAITPMEADQLRSISQLRNQVAHGDLRMQIRDEDIRALNTITLAIMSEADEV